VGGLIGWGVESAVDPSRHFALAGLVGLDFPIPKRGKFEAQDGEIGSSSSARTPWVVWCREFPCIFLVDQRFRPRDEFAIDCTHRQVLGVVANSVSFGSAFETRP
jgi:hypothetical protein